MNSLRWVCRQASAWATGSADTEEPQSDDPPHEVNNQAEILIESEDSANLAVKGSDSDTESARSEGSHNEVTEATASNYVPSTPVNTVRSADLKCQIEDSGYGSLDPSASKRLSEWDESVGHHTPSKPGRTRPTFQDGDDDSVHATFDDDLKEQRDSKEDLGRERHDSLLGALDQFKDNADHECLEAQEYNEQDLHCSDAQIVYNDDTDECETLSTQESQHSDVVVEPLPQAPPTPHDRVKLLPRLPSREVINGPFEERTSPSSRFYKIADGIDSPQILQQVSCLQCIVKQLPCDMKIPHCSRCVRSGHGPCLVQRELLAEERWEAGLWGVKAAVGYTVLVRLKEDNEEVWEMKKRMEEAMLEWLGEKVERENWIVPLDTGIKGVYRRESGKYEHRLKLDIVRGHV